MMRRMIGIALIVVGDIVLIVSLAADGLGIGTEAPIIGPLQIAGAIGGIVIQLVGIVLSQVESKPKGIAN